MRYKTPPYRKFSTKPLFCQGITCSQNKRAAHLVTSPRPRRHFFLPVPAPLETRCAPRTNVQAGPVGCSCFGISRARIRWVLAGLAVAKGGADVPCAALPCLLLGRRSSRKCSERLVRSVARGKRQFAAGRRGFRCGATRQSGEASQTAPWSSTVSRIASASAMLNGLTKQANASNLMAPSTSESRG